LPAPPALSGTLLRRHGAPPDRIDRIWNALLGPVFRGFDRGFERARTAYAAAVRRLVRAPLPVLAVYAGLLAATFLLFRHVPTGFIPDQDKGYAIVSIQLPDGPSLARTHAR